MMATIWSNTMNLSFLRTMSGLTATFLCTGCLSGLLAADFVGLAEINPPPMPAGDRIIAVVGGRLIDGLGGGPTEDSTIVIQGNRIVAVGKRSEVKVPDSAEQIDASGKTVLPGLIDSHFHTAEGETINTIPPLFLSHGVTTARDPGRPIDVYARYRDRARQAPRLFLTGPHYDQAPCAWPKNAIEIENEAHAREATKRFVSQGASAIKVYFRLPLPEIRATCETAHELGIPVTAHLELVDADAAIRCGLDGIEHITSFGTVLAGPEMAASFRTEVGADNEARKDGRYRLWASLDFSDSNPRRQQLLELLVERQTFVSPTLATFERRAGDPNTQEFQVEGFEHMLEFVGLCHRAGATVVTGSHTWSPKVELGWAYQREMELLCETGMSPMAVIQASTIRNAEFLGCQDRLGSLEVGKLADLVLVDGNPLEDIRAMYNIDRVMQNGRWVTAEQ
jgi:imidazolonepropionase-like amidohydrolase